MIGAAGCLIAFVLALLGGRRSVGHGLAVLLPIGFIYGYFRIIIFDGVSHFLFDSAILGLYVGHFGQVVSDNDQKASNDAMQWTFALVGWPILCILYSPLVDSQPLLVQFVGLRADALMIPLLVIGARIRRKDLELLGPVVAICCVVAFAFGVLQFVVGVEAFIPKNAASASIYRASDAIGYVRIPSMFTSAHAFGAAMAGSIPLCFLILDGSSGAKRALAIVAIGCAALGVFLSSTRQSVIILGVLGIALAIAGGKRLSMVAFLVALIAVVALALQDEARLQRFTTLSDTDMVTDRVAQSVNSSFFSLVQEYPFGAGLARAWGTSIPYFLSDDVLPPVGLENEFGRLVVEEGIFGVVGWVALTFTSLSRWGRKPNDAFTSLSGSLAYAFVCAIWMTAFIGAGTLYAVPAAPMLILFMGALLRKDPAELPVVLRHKAKAKPTATVGAIPDLR